jgi:hypothetical protein
MTGPAGRPRRRVLRACRRGHFKSRGHWNSFDAARGSVMKLARCRFPHLAAGAAVLPAVAHVVRLRAIRCIRCALIVPTTMHLPGVSVI